MFSSHPLCLVGLQAHADGLSFLGDAVGLFDEMLGVVRVACIPPIVGDPFCRPLGGHPVVAQFGTAVAVRAKPRPARPPCPKPHNQSLALQAFERALNGDVLESVIQVMPSASGLIW